MNTYSRSEAIRLGLKRFTSETMCKNGHVGEREVTTYSCCVCKKERTKLYMEKLRKEKPEVILQARQKFFSQEGVKEKYNQKRSIRNKSNPEKTKSTYALRYMRKKTQKLNAAKEYREANREKIQASNRGYYWNNVEKRKASNHAMRAKRSKAIGTYAASDIPELLALQKGKCACCRKKLNKFHIDHVVPLAKGGTNYRDNLQILCPNCNQRKSDKDPTQFMQENGYLI